MSSPPDPRPSYATPARSINPGRDQTLSSRSGFAGKRLRVRVDDVLLPSGRRTVREVVEHPGAVAIVPVTRDGHVLLIQQYHHAIDATLLGIPAGTIELDESPIDTARRELVEETGFTADRMTELVSYYTSPGYTNERLTIFRADECHRGDHQPSPDEVLALKSIPLSEIPALVALGPRLVEEGKTLIGLLLLLRDLG